MGDEEEGLKGCGRGGRSRKRLKSRGWNSALQEVGRNLLIDGEKRVARGFSKVEKLWPANCGQQKREFKATKEN